MHLALLLSSGGGGGGANGGAPAGGARFGDELIASVCVDKDFNDEDEVFAASGDDDNVDRTAD